MIARLVLAWLSVQCVEVRSEAGVSPVTDLSARVLSRDRASFIQLNWNHRAQSGASYRFLIQRKEKLGSWVALPSAAPSSRSSYTFTDTALTAGTYSYRIRACLVGANSSNAECTPGWVAANPAQLEILYVPAPAGLFVELASLSQAKLEWNYHSEPALSEFIVLRRETVRAENRSGPFIEAGRVKASESDPLLFEPTVQDRLGLRTARFVDSGLSADNRYTYLVIATRKDSTGTDYFSVSSQPQAVTASRIFLSRATLCRAFHDGNIGQLLNSENSGLRAVSFADLREQENPQVPSPQSESDKDWRGFLNLRNELTANEPEDRNDPCNTALKYRVANKIVIFPSGEYSLKRVKASFLNPPTRNVDVFQRKDGQCVRVSVPSAHRPDRTHLLAVDPTSDLDVGSDIVISNTTRFRILGCPNPEGGRKPKISIAGNFERTPATQVPVAGTTSLVRIDAVIPFRFANASTFSVEGLEFDGNSSRTIRSVIEMEGSGSAIRTHASKYFQLVDLDVHHMTFDGVYIGNGSSALSPNEFVADLGVRIHRLNSHHNTRIALMIAQANGLLVSASRLEKSGLNGENEMENPRFPRLPPAAGVDVEPNTVVRSITYGNSRYDAEPCSESVRLESRSKACRNLNEIVLRKNDGIHSLLPVDTITGNITFESSLFGNNLGRMFQSSLKAESPVPLTENIAVRSSIFRPQPGSVPAEELVRTDNFGLITKNAVIENNDMDMGYGRLQFSHNANRDSNQNLHATLRFERNYVRSTGAIDDELAWHPMTVRDNTFESVHASDFYGVLTSRLSAAELQTWKFLTLTFNPRADFSANRVILSAGLGPISKPVRLLARRAKGNRYSTSAGTGAFKIDFGDLEPGDTAYSIAPSLRISSGNRQAERAGEIYGAGVANMPDVPCNWSSSFGFLVTLRSGREASTTLNVPSAFLCAPEAEN